jgi:hypothetical protein
MFTAGPYGDAWTWIKILPRSTCTCMGNPVFLHDVVAEIQGVGMCFIPAQILYGFRVAGKNIGRMCYKRAHVFHLGLFSSAPVSFPATLYVCRLVEKNTDIQKREKLENDLQKHALL